MIAWVDLALIPLLLLIPLLGGFFLAIMPPSDRISLRHTAMFASIATGVVALRASYKSLVLDENVEFGAPLPWMDTQLHLMLDVEMVPILLAIAFLFPMAIRAGAPRIVSGTQGYTMLMLAAQVFSCGALLVDDLMWRIALLSFSSLPTLFLMASFGAPQRGSTAMRVAVTMMVTDTLAFASLAYASAKRSSGVITLSDETEALLLVPVILAGAFRLGIIPLSAPFVSCLRQSPVAGAALVTGVWMPMANILLIGGGLQTFPRGAILILPGLLILTIASGILGAIMTFSDRDLRRIAGAFAMCHGSIGALGMLTGSPAAIAAVTVYLPMAGLALAFLLFTVDAVERRYLSRDLTEVTGLSKHLPSLWRILFVAVAACIGIPLASGGTFLVSIASGLLTGAAMGSFGVPPLMAGALLAAFALMLFLWSAGALVIFRHVSAQQPSFGVPPAPFTDGQAARLWFPGVLVLVAAIFSFWCEQELLPKTTSWVNVPAQNATTDTLGVGDE